MSRSTASHSPSLASLIASMQHAARIPCLFGAALPASFLRWPLLIDLNQNRFQNVLIFTSSSFD
jgi:hypothetical protein